MILALLLSLAIGISLGMLGGGGSILTVPILVYVLRMEAKPAIATSLLVVGATSVAALVPHVRAGRVKFGIGFAFGAASMAGAFAGGRVAHYLPSKALLVAFAIMMLVTGLAMLRPRADAPAEIAPKWGRVLVVGVAVGLLTGIIGAGGGFVIVPALALLCGLPMASAVATSLFVIAVNSFAGFAGAHGSVTIDYGVALWVIGAAVVGSVAGGVLVSRVKPTHLRTAFAWLVLAMSIYMLWRETSAPISATGIAVVLAGVALIFRAKREKNPG